MVALLLGLVLFAKLRKLRGAQTVVLGTSGERDLVTHAEGIEIAFVELRELVESTFGQVQSRLESDEARIARGISRTAVIRYDAYNEMSGRNPARWRCSTSRAPGGPVLDPAPRPGSPVREGRARRVPEVELSPEEDEAIKAALDRRPGPVAREAFLRRPPPEPHPGTRTGADRLPRAGGNIQRRGPDGLARPVPARLARAGPAADDLRLRDGCRGRKRGAGAGTDRDRSRGR